MRPPRQPGQRPSRGPKRGGDNPSSSAGSRKRASGGQWRAGTGKAKPKAARGSTPLDHAAERVNPKTFRAKPDIKWQKPQTSEKPKYDPAAPRIEPRAGAAASPAKVTMRIAKAMARAGLCSRREAERWIEEGRVAVNGKVLRTPACEVGPEDRVIVDGQMLPAAEPTRLWRFYKTKGLVTTHSDPEGRETVFDRLPPEMPRVLSIGRLDYNTEGLLLLTNDGELARHLELPATGWLRRYRVRAHGRVTQIELDKLKDGIEIEGVKYGPIEATVDSFQGGNVWLTIGIREGKNREVRKVLSNFHLDVNRLIRISFGPFQLMDLQPGGVELVRRHVLADQLGPELAQQFGLAGANETERERRAKRPALAKPHKPS